MKKLAKTTSSDIQFASQKSKDSTVVELTLKNENRLAEEASQKISIKDAVTQCVKRYFNDLGDQDASDLYQMVQNEVEPALLKSVMEHTKGNQSKASEILGLNRGTLRKKLKQYHLE